MTDDRCDLLCLDLPKAEALRAARLREHDAKRLGDRAKAIGDATRVTIAMVLARTDELCVCDLAWITELSQNLVSHHVRLLRTAGLATSRRNGKLVMYRLTDTGRRLLSALTGPTAPLTTDIATTEALS